MELCVLFLKYGPLHEARRAVKMCYARIGGVMHLFSREDTGILLGYARIGGFRWVIMGFTLETIGRGLRPR